MSDKTSPRYQSPKNLPPLSEWSDDDFVVVHTKDGPHFVHQPQLLALGESDRSHPMRWDAASTEQSATPSLLPYGYLQEAELPAPLRAVLGGGLNQNETRQGWFRFDGRLPETGKYWFVVNVDTTGLVGTSGADLYLVNDLAEPAMDHPSSATVIHFEPTRVRVTYGAGVTTPQASRTLTRPRAKYSILLCLDMDNGWLEIKTTADSLKMAFPTDQPLAGRALVGCLNVAPEDSAWTVELNGGLDDVASRPFTLPDNHVPLVLVSSVMPSAWDRSVAFCSTTPSNLHGERIEAGVIYGRTPGHLTALPDQASIPLLDAENVFTQAQRIQDYRVTAPGSVLLIDNMLILDRATLTDTVSLGQGNLSTAGKGKRIVAVGSSNLQGFQQGDSVVAVGTTLDQATHVTKSIAIGHQTGAGAQGLERSVLIGQGAGAVSGHRFNQSIAIGPHALSRYIDPRWDSRRPATLTIRVDNVAIGAYALAGNGHVKGTLGEGNVAIGSMAHTHTYGSYNTAIGYRALYNVSTNQIGCSQSIAIGAHALEEASGNGNVAIGVRALRGTRYTNVIAVGVDAQVTGHDQVQLGNSRTTLHSASATHTRSDRRDMTKVRDTTLGLDFILKLRAIDYVVDQREEYVDHSARPTAPAPLTSDATEDEGAAYGKAVQAYETARRVWETRNQLDALRADGTRQHQRYHHGFLGREVADAAQAVGSEFGGFQDHSVAGGQAVESLGYEELIAPVIRAVQELHVKVDPTAIAEALAQQLLVNEDFQKAIARRVVLMLNKART